MVISKEIDCLGLDFKMQDLEIILNGKEKQILFGDTHVHTTYSTDAFLWSLPILNGEGPHPIADACDFARFCANLDFWVSTDHAEALTPRKWKSIKEAVRNCNSPTDANDPDLVTFLGYEWTQVGNTAETHYGHKNVMFLDIEEGKVPERAIGAGGLATNGMRAGIPGQSRQLRPAALLDFENRHRYFDFIAFEIIFSNSSFTCSWKKMIFLTATILPGCKSSNLNTNTPLSSLQIK